MATPRKRYVTIETRLIRESWPIEIKWFLVALAAVMVDRWANDGLTFEEASHITLPIEELALLICGSSTWRSTKRARSVCRALGQLVTMRVEMGQRSVAFYWPKWAEIQGSRSPSRGSELPRYGEIERPSGSAISNSLLRRLEEEFEGARARAAPHAR